MGSVQARRATQALYPGPLEAAQAKLPNSAAVHYHLGMSYAASGQPEKAADQFKSALVLEPDGTEFKERIRSAMKSN